MLLAGAAAAVAMASTPAVAQTAQSQTVTATGTGHAPVHPKNRHSSSSIAAAVDAARKAAVKSAMREAHEYASSYAAAAGMTLGNVVSVTDVQQSGFYGGPGSSGAFFGPFGPNRYCGTLHLLARRPVPGQRPVFKKVHRCIVPRFAFLTLTVTYSTS
jgi:hypothetical protein